MVNERGGRRPNSTAKQDKSDTTRLKSNRLAHSHHYLDFYSSSSPESLQKSSQSTSEGSGDDINRFPLLGVDLTFLNPGRILNSVSNSLSRNNFLLENVNEELKSIVDKGVSYPEESVPKEGDDNEGFKGDSDDQGDYMKVSSAYLSEKGSTSGNEQQSSATSASEPHGEGGGGSGAGSRRTESDNSASRSSRNNVE